HVILAELARGEHGGTCGRRRQVWRRAPAAPCRRRARRGRGRASCLVAAGLPRRRSGAVFCADRGAAAVARRRRDPCRRGGAVAAAPSPRRPRRRAGARLRRRRVRPGPGGALGRRRADARPPARRGGAVRPRRRCRYPGARLARRRRRRPDPRPRRRRAAEAGAHPYRRVERPCRARRPHRDEGAALSGAGADPSRRPRPRARIVFRRDRRGRLQPRRRPARRRRRRCRLARMAAAAAHRDDAPHQRGAPRFDRRGRVGLDHRQARRHRRRGQAGVPRERAVAPSGDRRAASRPGRRLRVLRRARAAGADPAAGAALADQEHRRRRHPGRAVLLSDDLRRGDPDRARLCHERRRLCRDPGPPAAPVDAHLRPCRRGGAGARPAEHRRRQLPDVVRGGRLAAWFHRGGLARRLAGYVGAVAVTTVVATLGTEPFSIYHFHHIVLYSPLANVVAVPISAMWTLPWGVVACLLMPFGLERLALVPMGWGIDATIWVAEHVSALPGNIWATPRLPTAGLAAVALGGLWLCLWQRRWRRWGLAGIAAGLATMALTRPPDLVLADFGRFLAARLPDGAYAVAPGAEAIHRSFLAAETGAALVEWAQGKFDCSAAGRCLYRARGRTVALITDAAGLPVDCAAVDAVVAQVP